MYAVHPPFTEVQGEKVTFTSIFICGLWWFVECGGTLYRINIHLALHTLHLTTGVDEGIVAHIQGCEDIS